MEIVADNTKLVEQFGAKPVDELRDVPDHYVFQRGLIYSHRDFDRFMKELRRGEPSAIVSGVNASGTLHVGHKIVFDTNLFFQEEYGVPVFIPISDDESYVSGKVDTQEEALENAYALAKEMLAYGFDPENTYFIIDHVYTNIYNLAFKLSKKLTLSEVKATYGYKNEDNPGLIFYPAVQSAHVLLPEELRGITNTLVPIGPDEDSHLRIARDVAHRLHYRKPAVLHTRFLPGLDGKKMSTSKNNGVFLKDTGEELKKKVNQALSGGQDTLEEHRELGGNPDEDMACYFLEKLYMDPDSYAEVAEQYRAGELLSGEVKHMLYEAIQQDNESFQERIKLVRDEEVKRVLLRNEE